MDNEKTVIHILDSLTANGIAAGEVIERPASVVKELVENALDAGADTIRVSAEGGGIRRLRVVDNGRGMSAADVRLAFLPHATSKLQTLDDLETLHTMGFRGEALASIAAVSRVSLTSRQRDAERAFRLAMEAGSVSSEGEVGAAYGTTVEVEDLFFNTPARYKFLKRDQTEAAYIQDLLERLSFTRPDVSLALERDGKESLLTPGNNDLLSVLYTVWGKATAEAALSIQAAEENIQVSGYIAAPPQSRKNRSHQLFIVNGRVIQSALLRAAVDQAAKERFVKGTFPELVLALQLPGSLVDVNVHPQKAEVRFAAEQSVFRAVLHALQGALAAGGEKISEIATLPAGMRPAATVDAPSTLSPPLPPAQPEQQSSLLRGAAQPEEAKQEMPLSTAYFERLAPREQVLYFQEASQLSCTPAADTTGKVKAEVFAAGCRPEPSRPVSALLHARLIGQVFNTYLLLEDGDRLLLVDQHAAHERILYEKLLRGLTSSTQQQVPVQPLLEPVVLAFSPLEMEAAEREAEAIAALGFDFSRFSPRELVLRGVPATADPGSLDPGRAFRAIVEEALTGPLQKQQERLREAYHTVACKAAVKGHDVLSYAEMQALFRDLQGLEDPYHCPHGRPVILAIGTSAIERYFERLV